MTFTLIEKIHHRLGWCPCRGTQVSRPSETGSPEIPEESPVRTAGSPDQRTTKKRAGKIPESVLTGTAILILFLTLFFGGNWWWPVLALGAAAVYLILIHSGRIERATGEPDVSE